MVAIEKPNVQDVEFALNCSLNEVYEHAPNFLCAGSNLLMRLPIGKSYSAENPVVSMSLILRAGYLSPHSLVKPNNLQMPSMFGIILEGSAIEIVETLKRAQISNLDLVTEDKRWVVYCGKAIALEFAALPQIDRPDPQRSEMVAISYYFYIPYIGMRRPVIEGAID